MTTLDKAGVEAALDAVPPGCLCSVRTMIEPNHNAEKLISASILAYLSTLSAEPAPADVAEMVKGLTDLGAWLDIDFGSDEPAGNFARSAASLLTRVAAERDEWMATLKYCERCWSEERGTMIDKMQAAEARALLAAEKRGEERERERCARVAERDADWTRFGTADVQPWENGPDDTRDYRLGIATGRAIAAAIRRGE